jgi:hypothetical protein
MTPLQLEILLHYYSHGDDYRNGDFSAPAVAEAVGWFVANDLLKTATNRQFRITERGNAFIVYCLDLPLPRMVWQMPQL